ncbi:TonB family protein [Rhodanobacter hydrolyticus]|uniref:TonB family protein n=2 Tax=Rhodanobacter hydrolyticus TaxID=2250595 RepID=A0ABW8JDY3_9GAMM
MGPMLLRNLLFVTAALVLVLLGRRPARRAFGASPAFSLWLLPVLAMLLPCLPELPAHWVALPAFRVLPDATASGAIDPQVVASSSWPHWLWLAGTVAMMLRLIAHQLRLRRQCHPLPAATAELLQSELDSIDPRRLRLHPAGPALLWAPRSLLLLPADLLERFDADERRIVLRHELAHLRRGDALWNLVAELVFALLWFHPLAWLARSRFRLDQELACDERVLRDAPNDEAGYARTLLHSVGLSPMPALTSWLTQSQLKERLTMIQRHRPGALRRRAGFVTLAALLAGCVFMAQAATDSRGNQNAEADLTYNANITPHYPESAIKNKEQGTVVLVILVDKNGSPRKITIDPVSDASSALGRAAMEAAERWHFSPQMEDGKPVDGYARVPVTFNLESLPEKTAQRS